MIGSTKRVVVIAGAVLLANVAGAGVLRLYAQPEYGTCASPAPRCNVAKDCNDAQHPDCTICLPAPGERFCTTLD